TRHVPIPSSIYRRRTNPSFRTHGVNRELCKKNLGKNIRFLYQNSIGISILYPCAGRTRSRVVFGGSKLPK
ncbi:hypothetical protein U1E44_07745, partial [Arenibacter sp. GZD96]|uniref:hypothetical protein n=1 Tax=Aurantibrevibacter litoralis TaxID=3106030 RepID=UPI002AFF8DBF